MNLVSVALRQCLAQAKGWKLADSSGKELTGRQVILNMMVMRNFLRRAILGKDEKFVGVILPASLPGVIVNFALTADKRVAVNLNFTVSETIMNECIKKVGIKHVLTSRRVMERLKFEHLDAEVIYLEDVIGKISLMDKIKGALLAYSPLWMMEKTLGLNEIKSDDMVTVVFTSGSTGVPKGVMLSHYNIYKDFTLFIDAQNMNNEGSIVIGMLPLFHTLGYTVNMWATLCTKFRTAYHYSPLDCAEIGKLAKKYKATVIIGAPTFYRAFIRKIDAECFAHMSMPLVGAERMPTEVKDAFEKKFGYRPLEAFGCTECSPVIISNYFPNAHLPEGLPVREKDGSIGVPLPEMAAEIRDIETRKPLPRHDVGMLWVSGPNVMLGYYGEPERTAKVLVDGWYCTGDLARMDEDGFIFITGRQSRFSKIGGEMVPHEGVEKKIGEIIGLKPDDSLCVSVTSIEDKRKGEKLIVLYSDLKGFDPMDIIKELRNLDVPPIWIPAADAFYKVDAIPVLGSGKLDIQGAKDLAKEMADPLTRKTSSDNPIIASVPQTDGQTCSASNSNSPV